MRDSIKEKVVLMKVDYAFKYVMRNRNVMKGFLSAVLGVEKEDILKIEYLDTNTEKDGEDCKLGIMDLLVYMNNSKRINIEIQLYYMEGWINRSLFYLCEEYTTGFRNVKGYADIEIPSAISINILDFIFLKNEDWVYNNYKIMNQRNFNVLTDNMDIHIIELKKLNSVSKEELEKHGEIIKWAQFIAAETWQAYEVLGREDPDMAEAVQELRKINSDEIERLRYLHREIVMRDEYQRKQDEEKRRQEDEARRQEDEARRQEDEARRQEDEKCRRKIRIKEEQLNTKEKQIKIKEEQIKIKEKEMEEREEEVKTRREEIDCKMEKMVRDRVNKEKEDIFSLMEKMSEGMPMGKILEEGYSLEDIEKVEKFMKRNV